MKQLPELSAELIKELDATYPAKHPGLSDTERQIWFDAGRRSLIDGLLKRLESAQQGPATKLLKG